VFNNVTNAIFIHTNKFIFLYNIVDIFIKYNVQPLLILSTILL